MALISISEPTMANLSIKDVPAAWTEALRQRAARNHRSLQGELMAMVEVMVQEAPDTVHVAAAPNPTRISEKIKPNKTHLANIGKGTVVGYDRRGHAIVQRGWKSLDEVLAAMRAKFPDPVDSGPDSLEILRAEREARDQQLNRGR